MTRRPVVLMMAGLIVASSVVLSACSSTGRSSDTLTPTADRPDTLAETNVKLGIGYMQQGKPDLALGRLQRALELEPNLASGHNAIAILYEQLGKLDLRLVRLMVKGGESGTAIEPGKPEASLFLRRIKAGEMPPGQAKVSAREMEVLERWIAGGAKTSRDEPAEIERGSFMWS